MPVNIGDVDETAQVAAALKKPKAKAGPGLPGTGVDPVTQQVLASLQASAASGAMPNMAARTPAPAAAPAAPARSGVLGAPGATATGARQVAGMFGVPAVAGGIPATPPVGPTTPTPPNASVTPGAGATPPAAGLPSAVDTQRVLQTLQSHDAELVQQIQGNPNLSPADHQMIAAQRRAIGHQIDTIRQGMVGPRTAGKSDPAFFGRALEANAAAGIKAERNSYDSGPPSVDDAAKAGRTRLYREGRGDLARPTGVDRKTFQADIGAEVGGGPGGITGGSQLTRDQTAKRAAHEQEMQYLGGVLRKGQDQSRAKPRDTSAGDKAYNEKEQARYAAAQQDAASVVSGGLAASAAARQQDTAETERALAETKRKTRFANEAPLIPAAEAIGQEDVNIKKAQGAGTMVGIGRQNAEGRSGFDKATSGTAWTQGMNQVRGMFNDVGHATAPLLGPNSNENLNAVRGLRVSVVTPLENYAAQDPQMAAQWAQQMLNEMPTPQNDGTYSVGPQGHMSFHGAAKAELVTEMNALRVSLQKLASGGAGAVAPRP